MINCKSLFLVKTITLNFPSVTFNDNFFLLLSAAGVILVGWVRESPTVIANIAYFKALHLCCQPSGAPNWLGAPSSCLSWQHITHI